jgi:hexosaminidase
MKCLVNWLHYSPGPYLHIGGDESHATKKEDYIPLLSVSGYRKETWKNSIGWDEYRH